MQAIYQHIALTLKSLRQARGWSLDKTAQETGVSKAMLGQIEREESSPTIATLWKIASGLHTPFSSFLAELDSNPKELPSRASYHPNLSSSDETIQITPLFPFDEQLRCEIFKIQLLPACEHVSLPHESGIVEHVIVVQGTIDVLLNEEWKTLHEGEGIRFDANQAHGYRNTSDKIACFHNIIHYGN